MTTTISSNRTAAQEETRPKKRPINFLRGWPHPSLLPVSLLAQAAQHALSDPSIAHAGLEYGPDPGYEPCREALAAWLTAFYRPSAPISPARLCLTGGASQSLGTLLGVYTDPAYTRNIWIVAPAYMLVFRIFEDAGFGAKMRGVPEDEAGLEIDYLREEVRKSEARARQEGNTRPLYKPHRQYAKVFRHVLYCVPSFSNPSSRTMTLRRRQELVKLAREFNMLVVCDDVYDMLQWPVEEEETSGADRSTTNSSEELMTSAHLPRVVDIDRELDGGSAREGADGFGNVCSNGTFSKLAGPGLRAGWVEGSEKFSYGVSQAGPQRSGGAPSNLTTTYLTRLLQSPSTSSTTPLTAHITSALLPAYASRHRTLLRAIRTHLSPLGYRLPPLPAVAGGYFIWLRLPAGVGAEELVGRCAGEEDVVLAGGEAFAVPEREAEAMAEGGACSGEPRDEKTGEESKLGFAANIRLCFAWEDEDVLAEGVRRVAAVTQRLLATAAVLPREGVWDGDGEKEGEYVVVGKGGREEEGVRMWE